MASTADKFARLSALRPVTGTAQVPFRELTELPSQTEEECMLARMIGASVAQTKFGNHLSVRNWHATPEFCAPSAGVIEMLLRGASTKQTKTPSEGGRGTSFEQALDPEKWLFL